MADRYDRRRIVAICMAIEALATLTLAPAALHGLGGRPLIYATLIVMSSARAFEAPTLTTLIPAIVPRAWLPRATALSSRAGRSRRSPGPRWAASATAWARAGSTAAAALYLTASLHRQHGCDRAPPRKEPTTWRTLFAGITFIFQRRLLLGTLSLDLFAVLLGGATALLPIFAKDILQAGPWALGALRAALPAARCSCP